VTFPKADTCTATLDAFIYPAYKENKDT